MNKLFPIISFSILLLVPIGVQNTFAMPVLSGPIPYLETADIPAGFYVGGSPSFLEDMEDGSLDGMLTADFGAIFGPAPNADSVDEDAGGIDGSGIDGKSWFSGDGTTGVTFTFPAPVIAAGIVWTDGGAGAAVTFEAFGPGGSLGIIGPIVIDDGNNLGGTAEDRFFGAKTSVGITALKLSNAGGGIEVDHVQYGDFVDNDNGCTIDPEMFDAGILAVGASVKVNKEIECPDDIRSVEIDFSDCGNQRINVSFEEPFPLNDRTESAEETIVNNNSIPGKTTCVVIFDVNFDGSNDIIIQRIMVTTLQPPLVGGDFLPIDSTALLLAAAQSPASWLATLTIAALGIGAYVFTRNPNNMKNIKVILRDYLDRF